MVAVVVGDVPVVELPGPPESGQGTERPLPLRVSNVAVAGQPARDDVFALPERRVTGGHPAGVIAEFLDRRAPGGFRPARTGALPPAVHGGWGSCYFSCSRAVVRKMVPTRWVNSAWVVTSVVNQSRWLPPASFFSASTTDSSAAW